MISPIIKEEELRASYKFKKLLLLKKNRLEERLKKNKKNARASCSL